MVGGGRTARDMAGGGGGVSTLKSLTQQGRMATVNTRPALPPASQATPRRQEVRTFVIIVNVVTRDITVKYKYWKKIETHCQLFSQLLMAALAEPVVSRYEDRITLEVWEGQDMEEYEYGNAGWIIPPAEIGASDAALSPKARKARFRKWQKNMLERALDIILENTPLNTRAPTQAQNRTSQARTGRRPLQTGARAPSATRPRRSGGACGT